MYCHTCCAVSFVVVDWLTIVAFVIVYLLSVVIVLTDVKQLTQRAVCSRINLQVGYSNIIHLTRPVIRDMYIDHQMVLKKSIHCCKYIE